MWLYIYTHTGILINKIFFKNGLFNSFINNENKYVLENENKLYKKIAWKYSCINLYDLFFNYRKNKALPVRHMKLSLLKNKKLR